MIPDGLDVTMSRHMCLDLFVGFQLYRTQDTRTSSINNPQRGTSLERGAQADYHVWAIP